MHKGGTAIKFARLQGISMSAVNSSWKCQKVDYLVHLVSSDELKALPNDIFSLVIPFCR